MSAIDRARGFGATEIGPEIEAELAYRGLQIAALERDDERIAEGLGVLAASGGRFRSAGTRFLFNLALSRWRGPNPMPRDRVDVVVAGESLLSSSAVELSERERASVKATIAEASASLYRTAGDLTARDRAIELDSELLESGLADQAVLLRLADLAEGSGQLDLALRAWRRLMNGRRPGSDDWYEARTRSLILLAAKDPEAARAAFDQHEALYPNLAPEPWGTELRQLDRTLPEPTDERGNP